MKTKICAFITIALFCAFIALAAAPEAPPEITIVVSRFQPPAESRQQEAMLHKFILVDAPNGAHVVVWDGWALTVVADVQLPRLAYDSVNARASRVAAPLAALARWYAGLDGQQTPPALKDSSAVKIPESLAAATAQPATGHRTIVILASPFNIVPTGETSFSMIGPNGEPRYPSDAHLTAGDKSIYSIADKRGRLANTTVLWSYGSENLWTSQNHRQLVSRWWCLYIANQGGLLAAFSADTRQVLLAAASANHRAVGEYAVNPDDTALVMHTVAQREVPIRIQGRPAPPEPAPQPVAMAEPLPAPPVVIVMPPPMLPATPTPAPAPEPTSKPTPETISTDSMPLEIPKPAVGNIGIAAVWTAQPGTDIDLWVAAKPGMPEAYWNRPRVPLVHYFRDIRTAQTVKENAQWRAVWEYVEVEAAQINEPTCWLNVYEARGPVRGIVRLQFDGRVVDRPFEFNVTAGNHGRDVNFPARLRSPYWQRVNLMDFLQSPSTQTAGR